MARIPYPEINDPESAQLRDQIIAERGKLQSLYKMLLHSPPIAQGWLNLLTAIRQKCTLSGRTREMVILRIAVLNKAQIEFDSHVPFALREGLTERQIDSIASGEIDLEFGESDRAVLNYTDSMTRDVHVADDVFEAIRAAFNPREIMELTATIATYNLVSRFLEALSIDPE